ncbi:Iron-sulfur cluster carrier protein [Sulfidibacter corallicola]|uniref:Iron-sulfur cluster carrier protein n=1 Tax=Sulfidibacter corallicola TaxID=2818388 RepID=A0A8A4TFK0_SULCO|nr:Mrp/NBP35 family ATP-binding protein [Sulfidibacter corallicola]QTD47521.1 Mrp/NBP35 family ATP-binding protein [Sulfidibacter corallicola]
MIVAVINIETRAIGRTPDPSQGEVLAPVSEDDVRQALRGVSDPDLKQDIVSLGFVKKVQVTPERILVDVERTVPSATVEALLRARCEAALGALGVAAIEINVGFQVPPVTIPGKTPVPGVARLIAVASGKGGVGKSTVAVNLALALSQSGARVGLLDCDLYGPSVPALFGIQERAHADGQKRLIPLSEYGIEVMSMGFLMDRLAALSWRGPMLHKMLSQFLFGTRWRELDYLLLDLPPGTGDVQLSLTQIAPLAGAVLVTTPQKVALRDVVKGLEMFKSAGTPVLGVIENMSYHLCPCCGERTAVFGEGGAQRLADKYEMPLLGQIPFSRKVPSVLGSGEPLMVRDVSEESAGDLTDRAAADAFRAVARATAAAISQARPGWAAAGPDAMEV